MSVRAADRPRPDRPPVVAALVTVCVAAPVCGALALWTGRALPTATENRTAVLSTVWIMAALLCAAATAAAFAAWSARHYRTRVEGMDREFRDHVAAMNRNFRDHMAAINAEASRLADETLPALVRSLRDGAAVDVALAELPEPRDPAHQRMLRTFATEIGQGERMRAAAMSACANAAGRMQALATSMLADLREMEERHDEKVLGDLLKLDHATAQTGRLADSIAVLTGARSGRRWTKPIVMESILRGAVGRISAYQRVKIHSASGVAIAGYAAEGVMHALAELMDNATSFSPPSEMVHVYVEEVQAGVVVTIEDSGLVMSDLALRRAERAVSAEPLDLTTLSGTRLGLAVVGCLARKHGMTVSFRPSSRGGTGVIVVIPRRLITEQKRDAAGTRPIGGMTLTPPMGTRSTALAAGTPAAGTPVTGITGTMPADALTADTLTAGTTAETAGLRALSEPSGGDGAAIDSPDGLYALPKRRRGQTLAATTSSGPATGSSAPDGRDGRDGTDRTGGSERTGGHAPPAARPRSSSDTAARFTAFRNAAGRGTPPRERE